MSDLPPGQGPIDPQGVFSAPPPPGGSPPVNPGVYPAAPPPPGQLPPGGMFPPPGMMPAPPMMYPPPPWPQPPRERSFARAIFMTLATTIFGLSLALNGYLLLFSGIMNAGDATQSQTIQQGDANQKIVVLSVEGIITDELFAKFQKQLRPLVDDAAVKALVVRVNSPGGGVTPSDQIYHDLLAFKQKTGKKIVILQSGLAASGGYYISCAGDYIVAEPTTLTGNVGVLMQRFNVSQMFDKWGVQETTLRSEGSPFKNAESMFRPETKEANDYLMTIINEAYLQFRGVVAQARQAKIDERKARLEDATNGKVYTAQQAFNLGLVDEVAYADAAYAEAARLAGLNNPTIVQIKPQQGLMELLSSRSGAAAPSAGGGVEINAVKIDADSLRELLLPRMMYLWDGK